jgi:hypothetical protein
MVDYGWDQVRHNPAFGKCRISFFRHRHSIHGVFPEKSIPDTKTSARDDICENPTGKKFAFPEKVPANGPGYLPQGAGSIFFSGDRATLTTTSLFQGTFE